MSDEISKTTILSTDAASSPFEILKIPCDLWPESFRPLWDAVAAFDPTNPEPLAQLLECNDPKIADWGLFVFDELGKQGFVVLEPALKWVNHPDWQARACVVGGMLSFTRELDAHHLRRVLPLAEMEQIWCGVV
ncbi:MAG: hypothetical protein P8P99_03815 [Maricaulis sp.]|nr:hypothetical protein [Maricaulis sp.]